MTSLSTFYTRDARRGHSRQRSQQEALIVDDLDLAYEFDPMGDGRVRGPSGPLADAALPHVEPSYSAPGMASPSHPIDDQSLDEVGLSLSNHVPPRRRSQSDSEANMATADDVMERSWWRVHRLKGNYRLIVGSMLLTLVGLGLVIFGVVVLATVSSGFSGWVFLSVGLLCFVPGAYHVVYIMCAVYGRPGYGFDDLPTFS